MNMNLREDRMETINKKVKVISNYRSVCFNPELLQKVFEVAEQKTKGNVNKLITNAVEEYITKPD
jgi:uncharacterized protein YcbK (DUF882 family)